MAKINPVMQPSFTSTADEGISLEDPSEHACLPVLARDTCNEPGQCGIVMDDRPISAEPPWPLAFASSQSLRLQVGAGYRNQGFDRASSLGSCLLAQGMTCLTHRAAPHG